MKKQLLLLLCLVFTANAYSQIVFEKGYYINNTDEKVECLIKNIDWRNNPTEFEYQLNKNSEKKRVTIETVQEFGIYDVSKYVRSTVNMDRASEDLEDLSDEKKPIFKEETLFLEVLIEGKANLYEYIDGNLSRYFFSTKENTSIEQLIYKMYQKEANIICENDRYKQQIFKNLPCSSIIIKEINRLDYSKKDLVQFFVKYNECHQEKFVNFVAKQKLDWFNLSLRPGLNSSSLAIQNNSSPSRNADFGSEYGFRFGVECELTLPFHKNKWAVLIEPTYQSFESELTIGSRNLLADYKSIELPIGLRHYFFLSEKSKVFVNASVVVHFSGNSFVDHGFGTDLEIFARPNAAFGLGYKYDRFSLEYRYQTNRQLFGGHLSWSSDYITSSVILGFQIF
jgi:hypothetical protein